MICICTDNFQPMVQLLKKNSKQRSCWGEKKQVELLIQPLTKLKTLLMLLMFVLPLHFTIHFYPTDFVISLPTSSQNGSIQDSSSPGSPEAE